MRAVALLSLIPLAACGNDQTSRPIGLSRDAPSELTVRNNAPLSMPPDLSVRASSPGAGNAQEASSAPAAAPAGGLDAGEQALVEAAGPTAPGDIRREVDRDAQVDRVDRSFSDRLMVWTPPPSIQTAGETSRMIQSSRPSGFMSSIF
jgi:hypothetical protein